LYMDDGHTFAYQQDEVLRIQYSCEVTGSSVTVSSKLQTKNYKPWWSSAEITIYGATGVPKEARIGNEVIRDVRYDAQVHSVTLTVPEAVKDWSVQVSY
jgi:Domain of unknown function (DUF5110)